MMIQQLCGLLWLASVSGILAISPAISRAGKNSMYSASAQTFLRKDSLAHTTQYENGNLMSGHNFQANGLTQTGFRVLLMGSFVWLLGQKLQQMKLRVSGLLFKSQDEKLDAICAGKYSRKQAHRFPLPMKQGVRLCAIAVCAGSLSVYVGAGYLTCAEVAWLKETTHNGGQKCEDFDELGNLDGLTVPPALLQNISVSVLPGGIPKVLHQMFSSHIVPKHYSQWCESWNVHHPGWLHVFWTDDDIRAFLVREHPNAVLLYDSYPHAINRADMARAYILWTYGGAYADMDIEAISSVEPAVADKGLCLVDSPFHKYETVQNSLMMSRPRHPFWPMVFQLLWEHQPRWWQLDVDVLAVTGPTLLSQALRQFTEQQGDLAAVDGVCHLAASRFLDGDQGKDGPGVTIHHYSHGWLWKDVRESIKRVCMWILEATAMVWVIWELYLWRP